MSARDALDGMKAREASTHPKCADCGKCRVIHREDWCDDCEYWSCERGEDCADAVTDVARLIGAVDAVVAFHKPIESGHPQIIDPVCEGCSDVDDLQFTFYPCETVEAIENALNP